MAKLKFDFEQDNSEIKRIYAYYLQIQNIDPETTSDLNYIVDIILNDRSRFPTITIGKSDPQTPEKYIECWVNQYLSAKNNPPSRKNATNKGSCADPAVKLIVKNSQGLSPKKVDEGERYHNLYMSAENAQG